MKKFLIFSIILCSSCSINPNDQLRRSQVASATQNTIIITNTWPQVLLNSPEMSNIPTETTRQEISITPTKKPTYTRDPTQDYEYQKRERYNYFGSICKGKTIIDYISPDLNWTLCVIDNSIFIINIDGTKWEISITKTYNQNIDIQQASALYWSNDGSYVYISYISYESTIALWRVYLDNGLIKEILISKRLKDRGEDAVYIISISPTGENIAYFNDLERTKNLYLIDLLSDSRKKILIGFGEACRSFNWSPDGNKLIFTYFMFTDSDGVDAHYDQTIYYVEFPTLRITKVYSLSHFEYLEIISITNEYIIYKTTEGQWKYEFISHSTSKI